MSSGYCREAFNGLLKVGFHFKHLEVFVQTHTDHARLKTASLYIRALATGISGKYRCNANTCPLLAHHSALEPGGCRTFGCVQSSNTANTTAHTTSLYLDLGRPATFACGMSGQYNFAYTDLGRRLLLHRCNASAQNEMHT